MITWTGLSGHAASASAEAAAAARRATASDLIFLIASRPSSRSLRTVRRAGFDDQDGPGELHALARLAPGARGGLTDERVGAGEREGRGMAERRLGIIMNG